MPRPQGHWINRDAWDDITRTTGLTASRIAEEGDVKLATLRCIVSGNDKASLEIAHRIARGARCRVGTLFPTVTLDFEAVDRKAA